MFEFVEKVEPVEGLTLGCSFRGDDLGKIPQRTYHVSRTADGLKSFAVWSGPAWPPIAEDAQTLAMALAETLEVNTVETFLSFINANPSQRQQLLDLAGAAGRLEEIEEELAEPGPEKDAAATREQTRAHAERVISEADLTAQAGLERAQRRLDESERGAKMLRERAAAEVARLQTEAHEHRRAVRDEATTTLAAARADADNTRAEAHELLAQARVEVGALAERRDDITEQLSYLSGVIEALAVPEHSAAVAEDTKADHDPTTQETIGTR